jgi:hypothetical protein
MWFLTSHIEALVPLNHEEHQQKETKMVSTPGHLHSLTLALTLAPTLTLALAFAFAFALALAFNPIISTFTSPAHSERQLMSLRRSFC